VAQEGADGSEQYPHAATADEVKLNTKDIRARVWFSVSFMVASFRLAKRAILYGRARAKRPLSRKRGNFRCLYLVIKRVPALMMFGFEFALDANVTTIRQGGVPPRKDTYGTASGLVL